MSTESAVRPNRAEVSPSQSAATVRRFLGSMERRDLEAAGRMTAPGFEMVFPGGVRFTRLEDLVAWAQPRHRRVRKRFERFDTATDGEVVYCYGTLEGEWPDGTGFAGIRFIDRFTVRDGRLVDQRVWNDLGEARGG